jgi:ribosome-associated protein
VLAARHCRRITVIIGSDATAGRLHAAHPDAQDRPEAKDYGAEKGSILDLTLQRLDDDQAQDVVVIDLRGKSSICDQMVVASGRAQRHVAAMAEHLAEDLKPLIGRAPAIEGLPAGDWVLIDAGDVIVHLFRPEVRAFYNLEKMWGVELAEAAPSRSNAS